MFAPPRILIIDDNQKHLDALSRGLTEIGTSCLPIRFTGAPVPPEHFGQVRLIFIDLHLVETGASTDHTRHFALIGSLLKDGIPADHGPYVLVLWTRYADQVHALVEYLKANLDPGCCPVIALPLDKMDHFTAEDTLRDPAALRDAIGAAVKDQPHMAALLHWETRVLQAAGATLASIIELVPKEQRTAAELPKALDRILTLLAQEAVGAAHVGKDKLAAVNDALLPILQDRIGHISSGKAEKAIWKDILTTSAKSLSVSEEEAARLNRMLHISLKTEGVKPTDRGAVLVVPDDWLADDKFRERFGLGIEMAAQRQYGIADYAAAKNSLRWVLVQVQAVCDHAQNQAGPIPYVLGLEAPTSVAVTGQKPDACWTSPVLELEGKFVNLSVNFRFGRSLTRDEAKTFKVRYRLREQILGAVVSDLHAYGARPGIISFRASEQMQQPTAVAASPAAPVSPPSEKSSGAAPSSPPAGVPAPSPLAPSSEIVAPKTPSAGASVAAAPTEAASDAGKPAPDPKAN